MCAQLLLFILWFWRVWLGEMSRPHQEGARLWFFFWPGTENKFFLNYIMFYFLFFKKNTFVVFAWLGKKREKLFERKWPSSPLSGGHGGRQAVRPVVFFKEPCCRGPHAVQMEIHCKHDPFAAMHSKFLPSLSFPRSAWCPFCRNATRPATHTPLESTHSCACGTTARRVAPFSENHH